MLRGENMTKLYFCEKCGQDFDEKYFGHGTYGLDGKGNIKLIPCKNEIKCRIDDAYN